MSPITVPHTARSRRADDRCVYCGLPVLLIDEPEHPGGAVIDQVDDAENATGPGVPHLRRLHRFCEEALRPENGQNGLILRRAYLGWATERHENGCSPRPYDQLGTPSAPSLNPELCQRHWRVRKMRYACKACRYYAGWF